VTTLKAEAVLTWADAPPTALKFGGWGASIELSEVCSSVGQLEARASGATCSGPSYRKGVMGGPPPIYTDV